MAGDEDKFARIFEESFASLQEGKQSLDEILARHPEVSTELRSRLEAASWLHAKRASLDARPGFVSASKAQLLARIEAEKAAVARPRAPQPVSFFEQIRSALFTPQFAMRFAVVLVLGCLFALTSVMGLYVVSASQPGEGLYPAKQALEDGRVALAFSAESRARLHTRFAGRRLIELQELILEGRYVYIDTTVANYQHHAGSAYTSIRRVAGRDLAQAKILAGELIQTISEQTTTLMVLSETLPPKTREQTSLAIAISDQVLMASDQVLSAVDTGFLQTPAPIFGAPTLTNTPTPTLSVTVTETSTLTPSVTGEPTATSSALPTASATGNTPTITQTPAPPATATPPNESVPEPTDKPEDEPEPTKKPTNTKKPLPEPTRRPPKPTKDPK